ncbi:MAG: acyl-CoA synthetase (AMP-forming)/AMP-acid ligase II [Halieaceae bacterium]|jgi:acyl-CoA synthetase (AMP-forming)/AMP-acid ligase II
MTKTSMTYNLADLFESVADSIPDRIAIICSERRLSFSELDERATRLANFWAGLGIGHGNHIGLQLRNGSEFLEAMLAAFKLRAVPINVNYHYVEGELEYLYNDADMVALVVHQAFTPRVAAVVDKVEKLAHVFCVADQSGEAITGEFIDYEGALASSSDRRDFPPRDSDDIYIVYTGGTTGMPKGVMWHHRDIFFASMGGGDSEQSGNVITAPEQLAERVGPQGMTILPIPPFIHAAAQWISFATLFGGGKVVIPPEGAFEPEAIWQCVNDEQVQIFIIVGDAMATPMTDTLEANPGRWNTSSVFMIASGGALFSPVAKKRLLSFLPGAMIMDGLGASETGLMGSKISSDANADDRKPCFQVNEHMTVLNEQDVVVEPGSGEIGMLARKGHVPIGYYNAPEKSAGTFVEIAGERWAIPGDLASVEADGTIFLHGRGSVSINTGGEKVFPEEVESVVKEHRAIFDAVVVGLDDERFGQKVVAVCQTRSGETLDLAEVRDHCRSNLANYKLPREVVCVTKIKRSPAGKADYPWAKGVASDALD